MSSENPEDRLRGNHERRRRLKAEVESLTTKMQQAADEAEEAEKRADACYQKIGLHNAEIERLRMEERTLTAETPQSLNSAADAATVFEDLRGKYEARFSDTTLPEAILAHKGKTSELLGVIKDSLLALSQIDVGFQQAADAEQAKSTAAAAAAERAKTTATVAAAVAPKAANVAAPTPQAAVPPVPARKAGEKTKEGPSSAEDVRAARRKAMAATGAVVAVPASSVSAPAAGTNQLAIQH